MRGQTSILPTFQSSPFSHATLVNGSSASIVGCDVVNVNPNISLTKVPCLSNFPFNLLLVSQLTHIYNCVVSFFPNYYVFLDLLTTKIFGKGYKFGDLYYLEEKVS